MRCLRALIVVALVAAISGCGGVTDAPLLVRGEVRDGARMPVPNARVLLLVYESGDAVPAEFETPIYSAEAQTTTSGAFEFRVNPTVELRALADRHGGVITFALASVLATGEVARWGFPRRLRADEWVGAVPRVVVEPIGAMLH